MGPLFVILIAVALGGVRAGMAFRGLHLSGHAATSFQAVSHLFVGLLIGVWYASGGRVYGRAALVLSLVELASFLYQRLS